MARNGSGTYSLPAGNPVTTGTTISSTWANNTLNDIGNAMTASLAYDGQTVPVANLPMGGYLHTNVANATARTNYAAAGQVQDGTFQYLTSVSGTDTITALAPLSMNTYAAGQVFRFIAAGANTTTGVTLNINSTGAKSITKNGTTALAIGDIKNAQVVTVVYDGTQFQLQTNIVSVTTFSAGSTGLTPSTATSGVVTLAGTLAVANGGTGSTSAGTSGQVLVSNGTVFAPQTLSTSGLLINTNYYTSSSTYAKATNSPTYIIVEVVGGGGGGSSGGGGGGGGGYARKKILASALASSETVTVGTGGAVNGNGVTSSFGSFCSASGGTSSSSTTGGTGGIGSSGDLNIRGSGGGGGGTVNASFWGTGGSSQLGGGGYGNINSAAGVGGQYGGGGGGNQVGAAGIVIVYEYS